MEWIPGVEFIFDFVVHRANESLINTHAFLSQLGGVVDGDVLQFWVVLPEFIY